MTTRSTTPSPFTNAADYAEALEQAAALWSRYERPFHPSALPPGTLSAQAAAIYAKKLHRVASLLGVKTHKLIRKVDAVNTPFSLLNELGGGFIPLPPDTATARLDTEERRDLFAEMLGEFAMYRRFPSMTGRIDRLQHSPRGFVLSVAQNLKILAANSCDLHSIESIEQANAALAEIAMNAITWKAHLHGNLPSQPDTITAQPA